MKRRALTARDYLLEALPGDPEAHGRFYEHAKARSWQLTAGPASRNFLARGHGSDGDGGCQLTPRSLRASMPAIWAA